MCFATARKRSWPSPRSNPGLIEREVKLRFDSPEAARRTILAAGATPLRGRRLQEDALLDTPDEALRLKRCILRIRRESGRSLMTFKGPVQPGSVKIREEIETSLGDADAFMAVLEQLGFRVWFRYEKYREEYAGDAVIVALDETPVGTFVELEGSEAAIGEWTRALGRTEADYVLDSYRGLFLQHQEKYGYEMKHMFFLDDDE